ncbi:hypothetical protein VSDG_00425 [Cytospora chrysosperma]|uniref:Uncharacterized protein n=1 Tax=Cytospora chrysosperma TaxID=252740 RepID=A0A423WQ48_CYTCH|nr:hypothetical protein VSDG_00425 [Valsa sordida]
MAQSEQVRTVGATPKDGQVGDDLRGLGDWHHLGDTNPRPPFADKNKNRDTKIKTRGKKSQQMPRLEATDGQATPTAV